MAEISAGMVKELREMTGLGMMECKKALSETGGDIQKAEELLRIKSGAKASKAAGRTAAEGIIGAHLAADGRVASMVEINCETDFVARNEDFLAFSGKLAQLIATANPPDVDSLAKLTVDGEAVETLRQRLVQKIGENIAIRRFHRAECHEQAKLALYVHGVRIGVIVEFEGPDEVGKDLAMHISFAKPQYLARSDVPAEALVREREILSARARESGKPAEIIAKMVEGGLAKFSGEMTLLGQAFIKDDKQTVEKMLAARKARVLGFKYYVVGEGIERKSTDFAAEVRAQAAGAAR